MAIGRSALKCVYCFSWFVVLFMSYDVHVVRQGADLSSTAYALDAHTARDVARATMLCYVKCQTAPIAFVWFLLWKSSVGAYAHKSKKSMWKSTLKAETLSYILTYQKVFDVSCEDTYLSKLIKLSSLGGGDETYRFTTNRSAHVDHCNVRYSAVQFHVKGHCSRRNYRVVSLCRWTQCNASYDNAISWDNKNLGTH